MASVMFNAVVATGQYKDREGNQKKTWLKVGVVMKNDDGGLFLLLDRHFNPAGMPIDQNRGHGPVLVSFFEPNQDGQRGSGGGNSRSSGSNQGSRPSNRPADAGFGGPDDDIPF